MSPPNSVPVISTEQDNRLSSDCQDSPHQVSPAPILPPNDDNFLTPQQSSPFEYSEESQLDLSEQGTPEHQHSHASASSQLHTNHELDSLDSLHLPSDINGDLTFTISYNYQSSTLFLTIGKVYNLELADKNRRRTEFYVKVYMLPDRWVSCLYLTRHRIWLASVVSLFGLVDHVKSTDTTPASPYNFVNFS